MATTTKVRPGDECVLFRIDGDDSFGDLAEMIRANTDERTGECTMEIEPEELRARLLDLKDGENMMLGGGAVAEMLLTRVAVPCPTCGAVMGGHDGPNLLCLKCDVAAAAGERWRATRPRRDPALHRTGGRGGRGGDPSTSSPG